MLSTNAFELRPRASFRDTIRKLTIGLAIGVAMGVASMALGAFCRPAAMDPGLAAAIAAAGFAAALLAWCVWRVVSERTLPGSVLLAGTLGALLMVLGFAAAEQAGAAGAATVGARLREGALAVALTTVASACEVWVHRRRERARIFGPRRRWTGRSVLVLVALNVAWVAAIAFVTARLG